MARCPKIHHHRKTGRANLLAAITVIGAFSAVVLGAIGMLEENQAHATPYPRESFLAPNPIVRIEPEGAGSLFDVRFNFIRGVQGQACAAFEGRGIGSSQWPDDPIRPGYTFDGWYDNVERTGTPYHPDTPIYEDTDLYARWKYAGPGGCWPRPHRGAIKGIEADAAIASGQATAFEAKGYHMDLGTPNDQRFRWYPMSWRVSEAAFGTFPAEAPYRAEISICNTGEYALCITYKEEVFDGALWQETGQTHEVEEITFSVTA